MSNYTTIPFFSDDIAIVPHSTSSNVGKLIGTRVTVRKFAEIVGEPVTLGQVDNGELYLASGRYPNISFIEGPELIEKVQAA
jgi:hypothetical protein